MAWRVGMKVVCVDAEQCAVPLIKGDIYTVTSVLFDGEGVTIAEFVAGPEDWWVGFRADRFRPVVEREYDISIFTAMLTPAKIVSRRLAASNSEFTTQDAAEAILALFPDARLSEKV